MSDNKIVIKEVNGNFKQIYVDSNSVCAINNENEIYCSENITNPEWTKRTDQKLKQITLSGTRAFGINPDNQLFFTSNYDVGPWKKISSDKKFIQVDSETLSICAVGEDKFVYCTTISEISKNDNPSWNKLFGGYNQVSIDRGQLFAIDINNNLYNGKSYDKTDTAWNDVSNSLKLKKVKFRYGGLIGIDLDDNLLLNALVKWDKLREEKYSDVSFRNNGNYSDFFIIDTNNKVFKNVEDSKTKTPSSIISTPSIEDLNAVCVEKELETQKCIDYCNKSGVDCKKRIEEYCDKNPDGSVCGISTKTLIFIVLGIIFLFIILMLI